MDTRNNDDGNLCTDDCDQDSKIKDEESAKAEKWKKHYSSKHKILLVGEGDFSFSLCLARAFGSAHNLVATSLDSHGQPHQTNFSLFLSFHPWKWKDSIFDPFPSHPFHSLLFFLFLFLQVTLERSTVMESAMCWSLKKEAALFFTGLMPRK